MKKKILILISCLLAIAGCLCGMYFENDELNNTIDTMQNIVQEEINNIETYEMTEEEIEELPSTEIQEQNIEDEEKIETEAETFELQGEIAYNGSNEYPTVNLGDYKGLTYYSQIDSRWKNNLYTSTGNSTQTIGSSGCGPTSAAMIVTAIKGTITPPEMSDLFVDYGFRSPNNGTYWSAYRWVADVFNIEYQETTNLNKALELLGNNNYVICSVGNGLFTTGGHYIVLTKVENGVISIYDPYLYSGKFETSTRRGKVSVEGNTIYCTVDNFKAYSNFKGAFAYKHDGEIEVNNIPVTTSTYTRYVKVNSRLNVRNTPNGNVIGKLNNGAKVTVYENSNNWSRIGAGQWVSSDYLVSYITSNANKITITGYKTGTYKVTSNLHVRSGASTKYKAKTYKQLTSNARNQNKKLGNQYYNGYKKGVVCTVTKVSGEWGLTKSGWICLKYCKKI